MGIPLAPGAPPDAVLRLVMRESMALVGAGIVLGLGTAMAASRLIGNLLFGVAAVDPMSMTTAVVVMVLLSAFAGYLPARRASRVDPIVALRYE
jgi:ABC-type antimicrobial peptide transport system permease subunit